MTRSFSPRRVIPLAVLVLGLVAFFAFRLDRYMSFEVLRENRHLLLRWVADYRLAAALLYMIVYAAAVALSVPGGALMSITGGFLFGVVMGSLYILIGATVGATLLFAVAKMSVGDYLRGRAGPWMEKMEEGFGKNALSYLIALRLMPLFPFFVVNLVPAFLGVRLSTYVIGTFVGIIPGVVVFASVGAGLGSIFDAGAEFSLSGILTPQIALTMAGLALLVLIPVVYKRFKSA
jgi:uncharacterized membrane protein YdjX (TVP38/TMEM64 family)